MLITDAHSQALLDTVYTNFEILQMNVTCELSPVTSTACLSYGAAAPCPSKGIRVEVKR